MTSSSLPPSPDITQSEPYLPVAEVAERLGVPLGVLVRRVEAGDVPARHQTGPDGAGWALRLSDLGVETDLSLPASEAAVTGRAVGRGDAGAPVTQPALEATEAALSPPRSGKRDSPELALLDFPGGPRQDLASMSIDPRELVAGLLDRWERTLEQRIHAEQRQRFEAESLARQNLVKQLQMELQVTRSEHAAVQAENDRLLAQKDHILATRERELAELRDSSSRRRGWRFRR